MSIRPVKCSVPSNPTMEGVGVKLRRAFGFGETSEFDPFLLLDDFRNDRPEDYIAGFPWHPHRGIETITYVLAGTVEHGDSLGNKGKMGAGDVQWTTAGSGILHQEMPKGDKQGRMHGFQLWANLASSLKTTDPRRTFRQARFPRSPTMTAPACASSAASSGGGGDRWKGWLRIRITSISRLPQASGSGSRSRPRATPLPMCSRAQARSGMPRIPARF